MKQRCSIFQFRNFPGNLIEDQAFIYFNLLMNNLQSSCLAIANFGKIMFHPYTDPWQMFILWSWKYTQVACQGFSSFLENLALEMTWMCINCRRETLPAQVNLLLAAISTNSTRWKASVLLWCLWPGCGAKALSIVRTIPGISPSLLMFLSMSWTDDWMWVI